MGRIEGPLALGLAAGHHSMVVHSLGPCFLLGQVHLSLGDTTTYMANYTGTIYRRVGPGFIAQWHPCWLVQEQC